MVRNAKKKLHVWAEEMALWAKRLPCRYENLNLDSQQTCQKKPAHV